VLCGSACIYGSLRDSDVARTIPYYVYGTTKLLRQVQHVWTSERVVDASCAVSVRQAELQAFRLVD